MTCSLARLAANQRNAQRSTGPRTPEGKVRSRANALKHGMTGEGIVLSSEDAALVDARAATLEAEMKPSGEMGRILLRRIAVCSNRLDKCERQEAAMTAQRVRDAERDRDDARRIEVNAISAILSRDPDRAVKRLMERPEGIDLMIQMWLVLRGWLVQPRRYDWTDRETRRVDHLLGRHPGMHPPTPFDPFLRAIRGDFSGLRDDQAGDLERKERKAWAREQLALLMDDEVEALRELRELVDDENEATDRAEAADRALIDTSEEGALARKYEADAERGMLRALREFHVVEKRVAAKTKDEATPAAPNPEPVTHNEVVAPTPTVASTTVVVEPLASTPTQTNPTPWGCGPAIGGPDESTILGYRLNDRG